MPGLPSRSADIRGMLGDVTPLHRIIIA